MEIASDLRLVVGRLVRKLRQAKNSVSDVPMSEASVLARLDADGPDSPSSLAALEGVRPQAIAVTLAALEQRGLVSRAVDPADGRRSVITITAAGRKIVTDRASTALGRLADAIDTEMSAAERAELRRLLHLLDRLVERL